MQLDFEEYETSDEEGEKDEKNTDAEDKKEEQS